MASSLWDHVRRDEIPMAAAVAVANIKRRQRLQQDRPDWRSLARAEQTPPENFRTWYIRGGRGSGKTWTGAHTLAEMAQEQAGDYGVIAPTYGDARDTCIEGVSGVLAALGTTRTEIETGRSATARLWNRSYGELYLRNGSVIWIDGADDGALRVQGKNLRGSWCDEVGLWKVSEWERAWKESIRFAVRLAPARIVATGTPKRGHPLVKLLMDDPDVVKTLMRTSDNAANIDAETLAEWERLYGGTTLGRQELGGEVLTDVPGALWALGMIEATRVPVRPETLEQVIVAIDPSATSTESSDECGIIVVGRVRDHAYVLEDLSMRSSPQIWAEHAVAAYDRWHGDRIVAETNNGGEMVGAIIRSIRSNIPYHAVTASRGKATRAEPISALYEQGKVHHVGRHEHLEDQMCGWVPGDKSPDRMDALVWGLTDLLISTDNPWARASSGGPAISGIA